MCLKFFKKHSLHQDTIERINKLVVTGELATMEYTIAKIVKAEDNPRFFLGQFVIEKFYKWSVVACRLM